jgi:hypothetical protein
MVDTLPYKLTSLENIALGEIQNWHDSNEEFAKNELIPVFTTLRSKPLDLEDGIYAAHVVAAAVDAGLSKDADISSIFSIMIRTLKGMHDKNTSWAHYSSGNQVIFAAIASLLFFVVVHNNKDTGDMRT